MVLFSFRIEIAAAPAIVRQVFFDWKSYPQWHTAQFKSIEPLQNQDPATVKKGDKLRVVLGGGTTFDPTVLENEPHVFKWLGSLPYIFSGAHAFRFEPSKTSPGCTTFIHEEDFTGLLSVLLYLPFKGIDSGFTRFNEDLKKRCEVES